MSSRPELTVLSPPPRPGDSRRTRALVFVKEGFCWPAFFFPAIWLIFRRLWLVLGSSTRGDPCGHRGGRDRSPIGGLPPALISSPARLLFALEGNGLRRWNLSRAGYRLSASSKAGGCGEAELRFFVEWRYRKPPAPPPQPAPGPPVAEAAVARGRRGGRPLSGTGRGDVTIALIDYGAGNIRSATKAFEHVIARTGSGEQIVVTSDPEVVARADRIVLPGDGAFADCRRNLDAVDGMVQAIEDALDREGTAVLRHLRRDAAPRRHAASSTASRRGWTAFPARCARSGQAIPR